jgi:hypothetical protein
MGAVGAWIRLDVRRRWRSALSAGTVMTYVAPRALWAAALVGAGAVVAANVLAGLPARRAARTPVASILRAE